MIKRPKKYKLLRPLTFVKPLERNEYFGPTETVDSILFIGEIKNMPGHGLFFCDSGQFEVGLHIDSFEELTEDET
jgi:hypothetical protein